MTDWQPTWRKPIVKPKLEEYIDKELADKIFLPEMEWVTMPIQDFVDKLLALHNKLFTESITDIPVHGPLLESIKNEGLIHPILAQHQWYPMTGNQRLRCAITLGKDFCKNNEITIARIKHPVWDSIGVWPDKTNIEDFLAMYFECISHVFKSRYNTHATDSTGRDMRSYEYRRPSDELPINPNPLADWVSS